MLVMYCYLCLVISHIKTVLWLFCRSLKRPAYNASHNKFRSSDSLAAHSVCMTHQPPDPVASLSENKTCCWKCGFCMIKSLILKKKEISQINHRFNGSKERTEWIHVWNIIPCEHFKLICGYFSLVNIIVVFGSTLLCLLLWTVLTFEYRCFVVTQSHSVGAKVLIQIKSWSFSKNN